MTRASYLSLQFPGVLAAYNNQDGGLSNYQIRSQQLLTIARNCIERNSVSVSSFDFKNNRGGVR